IIGSNFAESHTVGFRWVMAAKERGATVIHVDPHFSRTSQHADIYANFRCGTDIALMGGLINYILQNELYFKEYVRAYTNAAFMVGEDFKDTEDLEGVFSGLKPDHSAYDTSCWQYEWKKDEESQERQSPADKATARRKGDTDRHDEQRIVPEAQEGQGLLPHGH